MTSVAAIRRGIANMSRANLVDHHVALVRILEEMIRETAPDDEEDPTTVESLLNDYFADRDDDEEIEEDDGDEFEETDDDLSDDDIEEVREAIKELPSDDTAADKLPSLHPATMRKIITELGRIYADPLTSDDVRGLAPTLMKFHKESKAYDDALAAREAAHAAELRRKKLAKLTALKKEIEALEIDAAPVSDTPLPKHPVRRINVKRGKPNGNRKPAQAGKA